MVNHAYCIMIYYQMTSFFRRSKAHAVSRDEEDKISMGKYSLIKASSERTVVLNAACPGN